MKSGVPVRVRFAPSPTGHLHVGGLRTALFNYLFAKHTGGVYLLRCEDTDIERSTVDFFESQMNSFAWTGLVADEPVVIQSSRFEEHKKVVDTFLQEKKAYKCFCTQQDLETRIGKGLSEQQFAKYDRYCLTHKQDNNGPYVIRFCMPDTPEVYVFDDSIRGTVSFAPDQYDDFIIVRSDGIPVYNLVVVIDDAYMRISHVIRGEEHIGNTPKQIAIYKALNYVVPQFAHLPMILGPSGQKLSKRDGATSVNDYKDKGYLPEALLNYLARLGWSHKDQEIFSMSELIALFSLEGVGKKGAIFDSEKLLWINGIYIRTSTAQALYERMYKDLHFDLVATLKGWPVEMIEKAINLLKDRVSTLCDLKEELIILHEGPVLEGKDITVEMKQYSARVRKMFLAEGVSVDSIKKVAKELDVSMTSVAQPVRFALTGKIAGLGVGDLLGMLSEQEVFRRLERLETA